MVFTDHLDDGTVKQVTLNKEELSDYFKKLETNKEEIWKARIWKYHIIPLLGYFGYWHEFTVVESTNWWWSFEKQMDALYVQRSRKPTDVKEYMGKKRRDKKVFPEGRFNDDIKYKETIYNIIEWIINNKELNNTYHGTQSNCHYFASEVYEAIVRTCGKRLDDKESKSRISEDDPLRILRPGLRTIF